MYVGHTAKNSIVLSWLRNLECWQGICRWTERGLRENRAEEDVTPPEEVSTDVKSVWPQ